MAGIDLKKIASGSLESLVENQLSGLLKADIEYIIIMKKLNKILSEVLGDPDMKDRVATLLKDVDGGTVEKFGCKVSVQDRDSFDFTPCQHPALEELNMILGRINAKKKVIQEQLKNVYKQAEQGLKKNQKMPKHFDTTVMELPQFEMIASAEVITAAYPIKSTNSFPVFKFPKEK